MSESNDNQNDKDDSKNQQNDDQGKDGKQDGENVDGLKTALQAERDARKQLDKDLKALKSELTTLKNAGQSETDRLKALQQERDDLNAKIRERDAKDSARDAAKKAGAPDPDLVYRVLKSDIEFDTDGEPKNISALINDLKETTPHLFKTAAGKADAGKGSNSAAKGFDMNSRLRQMAGRES